MPVKLQHIVDAMNFQLEETSSFIHLETGRILQVSHKMLQLAEEAEDGQDLLEWQEDEWVEAKQIIENFDQFEELPTSFDIDEYRIMEAFSYSQSDSSKMEQLTRALNGRGAFRRFKDELRRLGLEEDWYKYKHQQLMEIARDFCESNGIEYVK